MHPQLGELLRAKGAEATAAYGRWSRAVELQHDLPLGTASVRGQMPKARMTTLLPQKAADSWTACPILARCEIMSARWALVCKLAARGELGSGQA